MPLVRVQHPRGLTNEELLDLGQILRQSVSANLTCDDLGAQLTPDDIEVFFEERKVYDRCDYDYFISIEASYFPSRDADRQQRAHAIKAKVMRTLLGKKIAVWLTLQSHPAWSG